MIEEGKWKEEEESINGSVCVEFSENLSKLFRSSMHLIVFTLSLQLAVICPSVNLFKERELHVTILNSTVQCKIFQFLNYICKLRTFWECRARLPTTILLVSFHCIECVLSLVLVGDGKPLRFTIISL